MQGPDRVRRIQLHLRRAGDFLKEQRPDAALEEVRQALALDPGSLAALALRERIEGPRTRFRSPAPVEPGVPRIAPPRPAQPPARPFVPPGVDAQSWHGFEQRIQERRFKALLETMERAIAGRDGVSARLALEEARELRPDATELDALARRVSRLPMAVPAASSRYFRARATSAVGLLLTGVALLVALDHVNDGQRLDLPAEVPAFVPRIPASAAPESLDTATDEADTSAVFDLPAAAEPDDLGTGGDDAAGAPVTRTPGPVPVDLPAPVDSSGDSRGGLDAVEAGTSGSVAALSAPAPASSSSSGEVPPVLDEPATRDNSLVAAATLEPPAATAPISGPAERVGSRRVDPVMARERIEPEELAPAPAVSAASSAPEPPAVQPPERIAVAPPPRSSSESRATRTAGAAAIETTPAGTDDSGVWQALNQYARAYRQLDARAARIVWPTVDERSLARAFEQLESQALSFDECRIQVRGARADASCHGRASFVGKVGSREERTEARQWHFQLRRDGDTWKIQSAEARQN